MRVLCVCIVLLFTACENQEELPKFPEDANPTKGYDAYIFACEADGEKPEICECQADILSSKLTDRQIYVIAEAGAAASRGDVKVIDNVMEEHPEVIAAMKDLSLDAEICSAAAEVEAEDFFYNYAK